MPAFRIIALGLSYFFVSWAVASKCPEDVISKFVVCYYKGETPLTNFNICNCTHMIFTNAVKRTENNSISAAEDTIKLLETIKGRKKNLSAIFTLETKEEETARILKSENKTENLIDGIAEFLWRTEFDGVELNFNFRSDDGVQKNSYGAFVKDLSKTLSRHRRVKRDGYDVFEKLQDDITTASYTTQTPKNSTSKTQSIKRRSRKPKQNTRKTREKKEEEENGESRATLEEAINAVFSLEKTNNEKPEESEKKFLVFVRLSIEPEIIAKKYDLKALSRYADILSVPTHSIVNSNEEHLTYHPSRLMGLSDILNTDSILDLLTGMGAVKSKMVISFPGTVLKFHLKEEKKNTPRSPSVSKPTIIDQSQFCLLLSKNNWTIERDDDLTAPYAFSGKTWLAFEDETSVNIKGKYILLRDLAGGAIYPVDADLNDGLCTNRTGSGGYLTGILHKNFASFERKSRALVLESLQEEIHDSSFTNIEAGVKLSEYRIVRVVDHSGAVHVIRKNTKTQFECSRQGYFSHPLGCNKFYRCVKFDQYSDEFTVFEYDCPAGLAFDERWEVCVWPGSLPHGAPCTGSSEIAPVPRSHYQCPNQEGYYSDPENCRWFFACLDHARDGITPLTAYEFRCPFGLVFSEEKLACDWPWLVGSCGNRGAAGFLKVTGGGGGVHTATFINGGNLEASFGQYGNTGQKTLFTGFGEKFEGSGTYSVNQGGQAAGFGYIAGGFEDNHNRAAFGTFPEYQISGGRILNKGGVVLDQNVAGIAAAGLGVTTGGGKVLDKDSRYYQQEHDTSGIKFQQLEIGSGGEASFQNSISTPKPFSVSIPAVQINSETLSRQHSAIGSTTPQTLLLKATPQTENINIHLTNSQQINKEGYSGFTAGQTAGVPFISSTGSYEFGAAGGLSSPEISTSFVSTPRPEVHRFGQTGKKISFSQGSVAAGVPVVSGNEFTYNSGQGISVAVPVATPKPVKGFEFTANSFGVGSAQSSPTATHLVDFTQKSSGRKAVEASVTGGVPVVSGSQFKYNSGVSIAVPVVTPKPDQTFEFTASGVSHSSPTESPIVGFTQEIFGGKTVSTSVEFPAPPTPIINEGQSIIQNIAGGQIGTFVTPSVFTSDRKIGSFSSAVSYGQTLSSKIDEKVSNELKHNKQPAGSFVLSSVTKKPELYTFSQTEKYSQDRIPAVTPKLDFQTFSQNGLNVATVKTGTAVSHGVSAVVPQSGSNLFYETHNSAVGVTPIVPFDSPRVEISKGFTGTIPKVPAVIQQQPEIFQSFYSIPAGTSEVKSSQDFVTPSTDVKFSHVAQPAFGQRYSSSSSSSFKQSATIQPFGVVSSTAKPIVTKKTEVFLAKPGQSKSLTEVSVEQQPVIPYGSTKTGQTLSTPTTYYTYPQSSVYNNINIKSSYFQPKQITTPVVSVTPSSHSVGFIGSVGQETIKPVASVGQVTTPSTLLYKEEIGSGFGSSNAYLPPVTPKIFGSSVRLGDFEETERKQVLLQEDRQKIIQPFEFLKMKNYAEKRTEFVQSEAAGKPFEPQEKLVELEITKSVELNPAEIGRGFHPPNPSPQPIVIQQQPLHLISQKTFPAKQVIQPFFKQQEKQTPEVTGNIYQGGYAFQQQVHIQTPSTKKQYSPPSTTANPQLLTFSNTKTVSVNQPSAYSAGINAVSPALSEVSFSTPKTLPQTTVSPTVAPAVSSVTYGTSKSILQEAAYPAGIDSAAPVLPSVIYSTPKTLPQPAVSPVVAPVVSSVTFGTSKTVAQSAVVPALQTITYSTPKTLSSVSHAVVPSVPYITPKTIAQSVSSAGGGAAAAPPSFTYSISKPVVQPSVYSEENAAPALPVFEASRIPFTKGTSRTGGYSKTIYVDGNQPKKVNLLLPQTKTDEFFIQTKGGFNSQKINKYGGSSEFKFGINPNIEIPEPPREYILGQNEFTTAAPEVTTATRFQSTSTARTELKGSTYLPPRVPPGRQSSKTIAISAGTLNEEEVTDDNYKNLFDQYSGRFGEIINGRNEKITTKVIKGEGRGRIEVDRQGSSTVQYEISSTTPKSQSRGRQYHGGITAGVPATNKYEEYKINGGQRSFDTDSGRKGNTESSKTTIDLKNLKLDKGKKTVIVVSQVSDANPVLIGKLAGQCSCQSNMLELRTKGKKTKTKNSQNQRQPAGITNEYLPPFETNSGAQQSVQTALIDDSKSFSFTSEQNLISSSTTTRPVISSTVLSSLGTDGVLSITPKSDVTHKKKKFRGRTRYLPPSPALSEDGLSLVPASEIASTIDYSILKGDESRTQNAIDGGKTSGAAFDRYGPGGWRGFDETLQGSVDCKRPGLFRHPKYCNKFYACNYDPWKERYTLHVFNCPIHLTYDSSITACNWPVGGPACADDNLLV